MKKLIFTTILAAGLGLASCGSNKTEGDAGADSTTVDTVSTETTTMSTDTVITDTVAPVNDTVVPAP